MSAMKRLLEGAETADGTWRVRPVELDGTTYLRVTCTDLWQAAEHLTGNLVRLAGGEYLVADVATVGGLARYPALGGLLREEDGDGRGR